MFGGLDLIALQALYGPQAGWHCGVVASSSQRTNIGTNNQSHTQLLTESPPFSCGTVEGSREPGENLRSCSETMKTHYKLHLSLKQPVGLLRFYFEMWGRRVAASRWPLLDICALWWRRLLCTRSRYAIRQRFVWFGSHFVTSIVVINGQESQETWKCSVLFTGRIKRDCGDLRNVFISSCFFLFIRTNKVFQRRAALLFQ